MYTYKRVRIHSRMATRLQNQGWKIILTDVYNGYVLFEQA